jgi:KaiC/GvpD/RAD55 family RecA-like ATPase
MTQKLAIKDPTLSKLLREGFVLPHGDRSGLVVLIRGKAGTGKSTLALQLLDEFASDAPRYYCTLEQSKQGLEYKLASMWTSRAINHARTPAYEKQWFIYDRRKLRQVISNCIKLVNDPHLAPAFDAVRRVHLPLYDEPAPHEKYEAKDAQETLAQAIADLIRDNENAFRKPLKIVGADTAPSGLRQEGSLQASRGRVLRAVTLLDGVISRTQKTEDKRTDRPIVVVDGLSLLSGQEREMIELQGIVERMRRCFQIGILVYEPTGLEAANLDHHADMVIELSERSISQPAAYLIHELCIRKSRYQEAALGHHQFKIRGHGIMVFPSLHFQVQHPGYMDLELERSSRESGWAPSPPSPGKAPCTKGSLIDMVLKPQPGESIVLLGSRNSFKTQLCLDFLCCGRWGCPMQDQPEERGLLVSLIDNAPIIERGLSCPWRNSRQGACWGGKKCSTDKAALVEHARAFWQRPGCITPSEFFYYLCARIHKIPKGKPKRVVYWDLTQMDYRFPLFREDKMLLPAMMDTFKTAKIMSLFMGAGNAENTPAASAMADHVLFCWRSPTKSERRGIRRSVSSLMLYVDRAAASSNQSGKALYRIPVYRDDRLMVPLTDSELTDLEKKGGCRVDLAKLMRKKQSDDKEQIERITRMQGVK